jgi:hypothetical protein
MVYTETSILQIASNYFVAFPHNGIRQKIVYPKLCTPKSLQQTISI